jgi:TPR repeat protein
MFFLGCELDQEPTLNESTAYFRSAADQGHPYSMWCYGLNLISGRGTEPDKNLGLHFIERSAEANFEGAIQFVSHAYAQGTYGYEKNEKKAASWWAKLKGQDVIRY